MTVCLPLIRQTVSEIFRAPPFLALLFGCALMNALTPAWCLLVFHEQQRIMIDSTLSASILFGFSVAVFAAVRTVNGGLADPLLLVKPVGRCMMLASKIIGIFVALAVFGVVAATTAMTALYAGRDVFRSDLSLVLIALSALVVPVIAGALAHGAWRRSFGGTAVPWLVICTVVVMVFAMITCADDTRYLPPLQPFVMALALMVMSLFLMATVASALSVFADAAPCMMGCACIALGGTLLHSFLSSGTWLYGISAVIPDWQRFWLTDAAGAGSPVPLDYLWWMGLYALTVAAVWLLPAFWVFRHREIVTSDT